jgi:hypothetical protein
MVGITVPRAKLYYRVQAIQPNQKVNIFLTSPGDIHLSQAYEPTDIAMQQPTQSKAPTSIARQLARRLNSSEKNTALIQMEGKRLNSFVHGQAPSVFR